jgi:RNase P/RNase MRP subunit p29
MIGLSGIVARESVRCLFVINSENEVKNLLKAGSVFEVRLPAGSHGGYAVRIWGDNIIYVGSERTKVRFKEKYNLDLY